MDDPSRTEIRLAELAEHVGGKLDGPADRAVRGAASLEEAAPDQIAFLANARYERHMRTTRAAAVLVAADYAGPGESLIRCRDPYLAFREAMVLLHGFRRPPFEGIDERAEVDPAAELGEGVAVGRFVTVCRGAAIGERTVLYPGVFVGPDCRVGSDCVLYPNVVLYDGTVLGDRVIVHAGSVIGEDGFGFATSGGVHHKIPQAGRVEVGDDVEIGACCTIDRAAVGATVIGAGTKMSNLVAIGHGTKVGPGCLLVAQVGVAGSTKIGSHCALAGQAGVVGHIVLGDRVRVGAKTGVIKDIPSDREVLGQPAMPRGQAGRVYSTLPQLPEMRRQLKALTEQVERLKARLEGSDEGT
jgi:UDP-3-O-[3-hydroxymyristoyl] glucosamine N-acyltransferase